MATAAVLVIGNEILTGKVQDLNVAFVGKELFALGVQLRRVVVCVDEIEVIAADVNALRRTHDFVITTGGVGPTHDDVTIEGIARAFERRAVRSPELESMLRAHYRERITEEHLRMALIPEGAELIATAEIPWPTVAIENVFVFPGVPELVKLKFAVLRERLRESPYLNETVYTLCDEPEIAPLLDRLAVTYTDVQIGSYLEWRHPDYKTRVTFDGKDATRVAAAASALRAGISPDKLVILR